MRSCVKKQNTMEEGLENLPFPEQIPGWAGSTEPFLWQQAQLRLTDEHTRPSAGWLHVSCPPLESFNTHSASHSSRHSIKADGLQKQSPTNRCTKGNPKEGEKKPEQSRSREKSEAGRKAQERVEHLNRCACQSHYYNTYLHLSFVFQSVWPCKVWKY